MRSFQFGAIINSHSAVSIFVHDFFIILLLDIYLGVGLLSHRIADVHLYRYCQQVSQSGYAHLHPPGADRVPFALV